MKKSVLYLLVFIVLSIFAPPISAKDKYITLVDDPDQEKIPIKVFKHLVSKDLMRHGLVPWPYSSYLTYTFRHYVDVNNDGETDLFKEITINTSPDSRCRSNCLDFFIVVEWYDLARYFDTQSPFRNKRIALQSYMLAKDGDIPKNLKSDYSSRINSFDGNFEEIHITPEALKQFLQQQKIKNLGR